jgi:hypothetical protein
MDERLIDPLVSIILIKKKKERFHFFILIRIAMIDKHILPVSTGSQ